MSSEAEPDRWSTLRPAAFVALLAAVVYANTLGHGFVWDDNTIVLGDPAIRSVSNIPLFFARSYWGEADPEFKLYRPLVQATLTIDWAIGGGSPVPFHATNLLLHVLATVLVYLLFRELRADLAWAFLGAALFGVHPVHTDAVDSIVQRAEVLSAIGVVGGFLAALRGRWWLLAVCAVVGYFSKETAATLPVLIAAWRVFGDRRPRWPAYVIPIGLLVAYGVVRWRVLGTATGTYAAFGDASLAVRALTMTWVFGEYARLLVVPWPLCADYAVNVNPHVRVTSAGDARFVVSACVLAALVVAWCVAARRRWSGAFWGAWVAVALVPVSNVLVPIGAIQAERFLYLPSVGACALLALLFSRPEAVRVGLLAILLFGALTLARNPVWRDNASLLDARMADAPENPWPRFRRAEQLASERDFAGAAPHLDRVLDLMPEFHNARRLRVGVRFAMRDFAGAAEDQEMLLTVRPTSGQGWANLALCHASMGDRRKVEETLERMKRAGCAPDEALLAELDRRLSAGPGR